MSAAKRYFDEKLDEDNSGDVDALEDWLATGVIKTTQDAITFWTGMQTSSHPLARMGLDYLSIPGMWCFFSIIHCLIFVVSNINRCRAFVFKRGPHCV